MVRPDYRRHGVATALLHHLHDHLDALGVPVYTAAASELLMRPMERRGYEMHHKALDTGAERPRVLGLWREAKACEPSLRI
ncbi:GNAT family N-acetyltransferase [Micromonospora sp. IBHARD004]|uniref:GNAT family N-acetyltransferase n=1 Tax=Micromonospora sp. IBHARD004 TaxID=3457764 RepID=UPI004058832D